MASTSARLVRRVLRRTVKPAQLDDGFVAGLRRSIGRGPALPPLTRGVDRGTLAGGEIGPAAGEWFAAPGARRHVLYLHGGYYVAGRTTTYRALAARMARTLRARVVLVDYRLAPEHPFPAALDDAMGAYRALLDEGAAPATVALAGDSAGGGLALATLLRARAEELPMPAAAVLLSPWTDLTCAHPSVDANDDADDMLTAGALRRAGALYAGDADLADPFLSPARGELAGLPPILVTVDGSETLLDDSLVLVERVRAAGGRALLHRSEGLFHVWPITYPLLPEARRTVAEIVAFLDTELV